MPQGPNRNDVHVTVTTSVIHNPGQAVLPPTAAQPVVVAGSSTSKIVQGLVSGTISFSNPA